jgi:glycerophosphoryl diester phosphodiesterase
VSPFRRAFAGAVLASSIALGVPTAGPAAASTGCVPPPVAHRGNPVSAPENTMPSFRSALRAGARTLETDVQFTTDGVPVLMHDLTVDRTTDGSGPLAGLSLDQVRHLDAGRWFGRRWAGTRVPTLFQMLDLAHRSRASVQVELKVRPTPEQMTAFLARIRRLAMGPSVIVASFDPQTVLDVRAAAPDLSTAIIDNPRYRTPASVLQFGRTYMVNAASVTRSRSASWRRAGISVRPWTVNTVKGWQRMALDKASAVITSRPARYLAWARARCR